MVVEIFKIFEKQNPNPRIELNYTNPYTFLVAIILSAQSTDKGVNIATESLFKKVSTPEEMLELGEEGLIEYIKTIGLFRNKAKSIMKMSTQLVEEFGSAVPKINKDLESLAGVGRKTANVFLNEIYQMPLIAVDTHVLRVSNRIGLSSSKKPVDVEQDLYKIIPKQYHRNAGLWLILHGRYVCKARKPLCEECKIRDFCQYYNQHYKSVTS